MASAVESVRLLLAASVGAAVNRQNERGYTALMRAMQSYSTDAAAVLSVVEALLDAGASVNIHDHEGDTPLHRLALECATQPWAAAVARLLLANGADASATNKEGETPAQCVPAGAARDDELYALLVAAEEA